MRDFGYVTLSIVLLGTRIMTSVLIVIHEKWACMVHRKGVGAGGGNALSRAKRGRF